MSAPGQITTARGNVINMDELKRNANKKPLTAEQRAAMKDEVKPRRMPKKAVNVRGNIPTRGEAQAPKAEVKKPAPTPVVEEKDPKNPDGKTLAELTGIKVDKPTKNSEGKVADPVAAADKKINDIMGELDANSPHSRDAADVVEQEEAAEKKPTRRKR